MSEQGKDIGELQNWSVLVVHRIDEYLLKYMYFLQSSSHNIMDFIILYDCATYEINVSDYPDFTFYLFNSDKLEGFFHYKNRKLPNPLIALLEMAKEKLYNHYLLMESDVVYTGNFCGFLRSVIRTRCDYVHIATDDSNNLVDHWPAEYICNNPFENTYFSWSQLFCISHRFLLDLGEFMKKNDSFYYEFLLPTMAYNGDYSIRQFENFGCRFQLSWGPADVYEQKYQKEHFPNTFYHPIKDLSIVDYQRSLIIT